MCIETKNNAVVAREEEGGGGYKSRILSGTKTGSTFTGHWLEKSVKIITAQMIHALIVGNLLPLAFQ